jgi:hypothetical protein
MKLHTNIIPFSPVLTLTCLLSTSVGLVGCGNEVDEGAQMSLEESGYSAEGASELSKLELSPEEIKELEIAKRGGLDDAAAAQIVKTLHNDELAFDIGMEMQTLSGAGFSTTALIELVDMGAVRPWESDLRVMKHAGIGEPTILEIASRKFKEGKEDVLSGKDYERLKMSGISDAAIEQFLENGGDRRQMQKVDLSVRQGTPEQTALKEAGLGN